MQPKDIARNTAKVVQNYLTYQAVKLIIDQLTQTNPQQAIWLRKYSSGGRLQDGEKYLEELMSELQGKPLVMRILTVRNDLAEKTMEFLPSMVSSSIQQANLEHRRHLLERLTKTSTEPDNTESDTQESSEENN